MIVFVSVSMSDSLVTMYLVYSSTWVVRFMLAPVRLVTVILSSGVAGVRLLNSSSIMIMLLA